MFVYTNCYRKYLVSGRQDRFAFYFLLDNYLFLIYTAVHDEGVEDYPLNSSRHYHLICNFFPVLDKHALCGCLRQATALQVEEC